MAENQFNEAPGDGEQFYMAAVEATYEGDESSTFWIDMTLKAVGDASVAYEGFDGSCGVVPSSLDDAGETFPADTISGNVCWKVRSDDVGSLVMIAEESFSSTKHVGASRCLPGDRSASPDTLLGQSRSMRSAPTRVRSARLLAAGWDEHIVGAHVCAVGGL